LEECKKIVARQGGCKTGEAVITTAGNLPAKYVIHTVGPTWNGGMNHEKEKLANCYVTSLQLAVDHNCKTIAFPNISTGVYRFPKIDAAKIAVDRIENFLSGNNSIDKVIIVCFDEENYQYALSEVQKFAKAGRGN
jgi:O-acetyl-ADP-ribose deacetylase